MTLGENLKNIREEAGLSFEDLAEKTKIQVKYLKYLENEEFGALPGPVYIKGYIKKWATACGADPNKLALQFQRENEEILKHKTGKEKIQSPSSPSFVITSKHIVAVIIIVALVALLSFFYFNQRLVSEVPSIEVVHPSDFNSVTEDELITIHGEADNAQVVYVNGEQVQIEKTGQFSYTYTLNAGMNTIVIRAKSSAGREVETARKILKL
ncbi:MAG: helix-turn-helix domain-containing protein [Candidatus Spechtbacterales bacterium]|nr:helix-turn-helix domain-containing protein [Candidatus Spechtbacterales bacterium]